MGRFKQAFAQMGGSIRGDFRRLRYEFSVRSFFTILFGLILLALNIYLFVASSVKLFEVGGRGAGLHFAGGLFGFLISILLIFFVTLHFSVAPQERAVEEGSQPPFDKKNKAWLLSIIFAVVLTFGGGATALGIYINNEIKYDAYPQTTATVVDLYNNGFHRGYTAIYEYTVDGITYKTKGELMGSGEAVPWEGDTVTIKYDPLNPNTIYISTESKFPLAFGCFLIFFGFAIIAGWLYSAKKLKPQFLLAFILLGLTACIFVAYLGSMEFHSVIPFFARNFMLHFVLIFTNVGLLELLNGIVYIGYKEKMQ